MATTQCVACDEEINMTMRVRLGQRITCDHCGAALEVVSVAPFEVELAGDEEEEWVEDDPLLLDDSLSEEDEELEDDGLDDELDDDSDFDDFEDDDFDEDDFEDDEDDDIEDDRRW